jgi:iron complex outermembrane receptor protein
MEDPGGRTLRPCEDYSNNSPSIAVLPNSGPLGPTSGSSSSSQARTGGTILRNRLSHFSPHAGVVFQPVPSASVYFSHSQSFQFLPFNPLLFNLQIAGAPSAATCGRQYEGGLKLDTLGNRIQATISYFYLVKDGLPNALNSGAQTESQTSRGVELDLVDQLTRRWSILTAYAYDRNSGTVDDPILNAPLHGGNVWTTYRVDRRRLHNLIIGAGANYVDWRQANPLNGTRGNGGNFQLPPSTRLDAMAAYEIKENHWRLQVNVRDLSGRKYYQTDAVFAIIYPAARSVQASVKYQF